MKLRSIATACVCFGLLASCKSAPTAAPVVPPSSSTVSQLPPSTATPTNPAPQPTSVSPAAARDVSAGDQDFAARLYGQLRSEPGNLFFSPASIRMALAMTYAGASGETQSQMAKVLAVGPSPHSGFASLLADWNSRSQVASTGSSDWEKAQAERSRFTLRVVNRIWGGEDITFRPAFLELLRTQYSAPLQKLDFVKSAEPSRLAINQWVEQQTEHRIKDLLPKDTVTPQTRMVLTNAAYFKATWQNEFYAGATKSEDFFVRPNAAVKVPMMHLEDHLSYAAVTVGGAPAKALSLPYQAPDLTMLVLIPDAKDGLAQLEGALNGAVLESVQSQLQSKLVNLAMPKFKATLSFKLAKTLSAMGMPIAFKPVDADFSPMDGTREIYLSDVIHKAFVEIDEKGTEAAAATAVVADGATAAIVVEQPIQVRLDHPYVFLILDTRHSSVLFMGRIADPSQGG